MNKVFTIGCSTLEVKSFINLLKKNKINAVADVRSVPFSNYSPQFNSSDISLTLKNEGIVYLDFSKEFGARRDLLSDYKEDQVDFSKVINTDLFLQGVNRIKKGLTQGYNIALMCTEKDPLECHRFGMVTRGLKMHEEIEIVHIHSDSKLEANDELEKRMLKKYKIEPDFFINDILLEAYRKQNEDIGYKKKEIEHD